MRGRFSEREEGWGGGEVEVGDERKDQEQLKMTFWNVCGWTDTDGGEMNRGVRDDDMRARVLGVLPTRCSSLGGNVVERKGGCPSEGVSVVWKEQEVC